MTVVYEGRKFVFEQWSLLENCWIDSDQKTFDQFVVDHRSSYEGHYDFCWKVFEPRSGFEFLPSFRIRPERSDMLI